MRVFIKPIPSIVVTICLLCVSSLEARAQTICDLLISFTDLASEEETVEHKTDYWDGTCQTQAVAKVKQADLTWVDLKIDRSCSDTGQVQITTAIEIVEGEEPTGCHVDYDNPLAPFNVRSETAIADVPELKQLISDAAAATEEQFGDTNPLATAVQEKLLQSINSFPADLAGFDAVISIDGVPQVFRSWELSSEYSYGNHRSYAAIQDASNVVRLAVPPVAPQETYCRTNTAVVLAYRHGPFLGGTEIVADVKHYQGFEESEYASWASCEIWVVNVNTFGTSHLDTQQIHTDGIYRFVTPIEEIDGLVIYCVIATYGQQECDGS